MELLLSVVAGACLGALLAWARVPRLRWLPLVCVLLLMGVSVIAIALYASWPFLDGLAFAVTALATSWGTSAAIWTRRGLGEVFSPWQLTWMSATRPGFLRGVDQQHHLSDGPPPRTPPG